MHSKKIKPRNGPTANCREKIHNRKCSLFLFVFLGKNAVLLDTNAILFEQCEILIHIGGSKMQIVTLYSSTI